MNIEELLSCSSDSDNQSYNPDDPYLDLFSVNSSRMSEESVSVNSSRMNEESVSANKTKLTVDVEATGESKITEEANIEPSEEMESNEEVEQAETSSKAQLALSENSKLCEDTHESPKQSKERAPNLSSKASTEVLALEKEADVLHVASPIPLEPITTPVAKEKIHPGKEKASLKKPARKVKKPAFQPNPYFVNKQNKSLFVMEEDLKQFKYVSNRLWGKSFQNITTETTKADSKERGSMKPNLQSPTTSDKKTRLISKSQEDALKLDVFNDTNYNEYCKITKDDVNSPLKSQFLVNLIIDNNLQSNVLKYDENEKQFRACPIDEIYKILEETFAKRTRNTRQRDKNINQTDVTIDVQQNSTFDDDHPLHNYLKFGNMFYSTKSDQDEWSDRLTMCRKSKSNTYRENALEKYTKEEYLDETAHSMFSVLHPLYENYELIMYNGSHRLDYSKKDNEHTLVHSCSKIVLKIPEPSLNTDWKTFFVIIDSRLVHGGARARRESIMSAHHSYNFRLFTYVVQTYQGTRSKLSKDLDEGDPNADNTFVQNTKTESIDQTSFHLCDPYKCEKCKNITPKEIIIDIGHEYKTKKEGRKKTFCDTSSIICPKSYICGDLDEHGWEVHVGVDYMNIKKFRYLRIHLEYLFHGPSIHWNEIVQNKGRCYLKLKTMINSSNTQFLKSREYLAKEFMEEQTNILRKIRGFKKHETDSNALFVNRGICQEQNLHRDYVKPMNKAKGSARSIMINEQAKNILEGTNTFDEDSDRKGPRVRFSRRRRTRTTHFSPQEDRQQKKKKANDE